MLNILKYIEENAVDGILFRADTLIKAVNANKPKELAEAYKKTADLLFKIQDESIRATYQQQLCEKYNINAEIFDKRFIQLEKEAEAKRKKEVEKKRSQILEKSDGVMARIPDGVSVDEYYTYLVFEQKDGNKTGYWFPLQNGAEYEKKTNFVLKPLFHIKSPEKNCRLLEATCFIPQLQRYHTALIEFNSDEFIKLDSFKCKLYDEGPFFVEASMSKIDLSRINKKYNFDFPVCYELRNLGQQAEGFFAFANNIYKDGELREYDKYGVVEVEGQHFLSPSVAETAKQIRTEESLYENDKHLSFVKTDLTFQTWCELIVDCYGDNGKIGVAFAVTTLFADIIRRQRNIPLMYPYGVVESGKSAFSESVQNLFFKGLMPFNLSTSSTDFAFWSRLERFKNCPVVYNEFDENAIKDEWFRAFKGMFEEQGREKGRGRDGKTMKQKVAATVILVGQYLSTKDDNSVLSRSIPCLVKPKTFTQKEVERFNFLKEKEKSGLSSIICEMLVLREAFNKNYHKTYNEIHKEISSDIKSAGKTYKNRILESYTVLVASVKLAAETFKLPFTYNEFKTYAVERIIEFSGLINESNALAEFWKVVEYMVNRGELQENWHYRIIGANEITLSDKENRKVQKQFDEPKKLLLIRLSDVFREYARTVKQTTAGKSLNEQTLKTYLYQQNYYIGNNPSQQFKVFDKLSGNMKKMTTSSIVLDYELMNINIEQSSEFEDEREPATLKVKITTRCINTTLDNKFQFRACREIDENGNTQKEFITCFIDKSDKAEQEILVDKIVELEGMVTKPNAKGYRNMDVKNYVIFDTVTGLPALNSDDPAGLF